MEKSIALTEKKPIKYSLLILIGLTAGFINGFLGSGGGIILIFALSFLYKEIEVKDYFFTSVVSIIPMSVVSAIFYVQRDAIKLPDAFPYVFPAIIGGICGALLFSKLPATLLKLFFALLMLWAGIRMAL